MKRDLNPRDPTPEELMPCPECHQIECCDKCMERIDRLVKRAELLDAEQSELFA